MRYVLIFVFYRFPSESKIELGEYIIYKNDGCKIMAQGPLLTEALGFGIHFSLCETITKTENKLFCKPWMTAQVGSTMPHPRSPTTRCEKMDGREKGQLNDCNSDGFCWFGCKYQKDQLVNCTLKWRYAECHPYFIKMHYGNRTILTTFKFTPVIVSQVPQGRTRRVNTEGSPGNYTVCYMEARAVLKTAVWAV